MTKIDPRRLPRVLAALGLAFILFTGVSLAGDRWLHVRVLDQSDEGASVKINMPLEAVRALLPAFQEAARETYRDIKRDLARQGVDLNAIRSALTSLPDGEFVTAESGDEKVRIAKENGFLIVRVDAETKEKVNVKLPMDVFEIIVAAGDDESVDLVAVLDALATSTGEDLIQVTDAGSSVRIWIDELETAD